MVVPADSQSNANTKADNVPLSQHYDEKQEGTTTATDGNLPHVHVEEEPKIGTPHNNMNKYQKMQMMKKMKRTP